MTQRVLQSWLYLSTTLVVACSGGDDPSDAPSTVPISHQSAALTAQQNTERALRGLLDAGGFVVGNEVVITLDLELVKNQ